MLLWKQGTFVQWCPFKPSCYKLLKGYTSMKPILPALCAAVLLTTLGPLPARADWWWHRHSNPGPAGVGADKNDKRTKSHHERAHHEKTAALYSAPKSVGWWHKTPGPMGAGSGESGKMQTARRERHHKEKSAQRSQRHRNLFAWLHHHNSNSATPGAANGK
jgi:hypothetical protein